MSTTRFAAVCWVQREDGRVLVVWNKRYRCWTLPGGMVEGGETFAEGAERELFEETGCYAHSIRELYEAPAPPADPNRGSHVWVFAVTLNRGNVPSERELGCPVSWFTVDEFLSSCTFRDWYREMLAEPEWSRRLARARGKR